MKKALSSLKKKFRSYLMADLISQQQNTLLLMGKLQAERVRALEASVDFARAEFRVFSQWGEDGIIQFLLGKVPTPNQTFLEIGVQNYVESNTRFLLLNDNWSGSVVDASSRDIQFIRNDPIYWRHDLTAIEAFVTKESIGTILGKLPQKEIDLLSIDIDGNDYWIWKEIQSISPRIVICEYNGLFGCERAVTVPYQADFYRTAAHYSNLYFGASLPALCQLAEQKGYALVGTNTAGNDAFFVRKDVLGALTPKSAKEGFTQPKFRESRDSTGNLNFLDRAAAAQQIKDLPLVYLD